MTRYLGVRSYEQWMNYLATDDDGDLADWVCGWHGPVDGLPVAVPVPRGAEAIKRANTMTKIAEVLRRHVDRRYGTQAAAAVAWGVTQPFVSMVLRGVKKPTTQILNDAGIECVVIYRKKKT